MKFLKYIFNIIFVALALMTNGQQNCTNPTDETIIFQNGGTAKITWSAVPEAEAYHLQYKFNTVAWENKYTTQTFIDLVGFDAGLSGEYRVRSKCANGFGVWEVATTTFTVPTTCINPTVTNITFPSEGKGQFFWSPITGAIEYTFKYRLKGSSDNWVEHITSNTNIYIQPLISNEEYEYTLSSDCSTVLSAVEYFTVPETPTSLCVHPSDETFSLTSNNEIQIDWSPIPEAVYHRFVYRPVGSSDWLYSSNIDPPPRVMPYLSLGLEYEYYWQTLCSNGAGWLPHSPIKTFIINTANPCFPPTGNQVTINNDGTVLISWDIVLNAVSYDVRYRAHIGGTWSQWTYVNSVTNSVVLNNLEPHIFYDYEVRTNCSQGTSVFWKDNNEFKIPFDIALSDLSCGIVFNNCKDELISYIQDNIACKQWEGCTKNELIYREGRVGIGTEMMASGFNLAVRGGVISDHIWVQLCEDNGWCDYVFEPEYDLMPLEKVENHIKEKGHLHNTPSSQDIKEGGGIELRKIKLNQQEKIEEVFLHLIELNTRVEKLKEEIEELEKENTQLQKGSKFIQTNQKYSDMINLRKSNVALFLFILCFPFIAHSQNYNIPITDCSDIISGCSNNNALNNLLNTQQDEILCNQWDGDCTTTSSIYRIGKVSIGTNKSPSNTFSALTVTKGIITDHAKVQFCKDGGWCDYVFESDYNLIPLEEVEKHIAEKGHLHNTPSAAEIEEKGSFELKAVSLNQQEKIEEAFLHLIAMKKEADELQVKLKKLKAENERLKKL